MGIVGGAARGDVFCDEAHIVARQVIGSLLIGTSALGVVIVGEVVAQLLGIAQLVQIAQVQRVGIVAQGDAYGRTARVENIGQYRGAEPVAVVVLYGAVYTIPRIVIAVEDDVLVLFAEVHQVGLAVPQHIVIVPQAHTERFRPHPLGLVFQLEVDGGRFRLAFPLQRPHVFVILQHLHGSHILGLDSLRGNAISSLQHIHILYIEMVDGYALVFYQSTLDGDAG